MDDTELKPYLEQLNIPEASSDAARRISMMAKETPQRGLKALKPVRQFKAWLYVPNMRYAVMASVVGVFMLIGTLVPNPAKQERTEITANDIPSEVVLYDVDFVGSELGEEFWEG